MDFIEHALRKCPFLHCFQEVQGPDAARELASRPFAKDARQAPIGPILEESYSFDATFSLVHGPGGSVPLDPLSIGRNGGRHPFVASPKPAATSSTGSEQGQAEAVKAPQQGRTTTGDVTCSRATSFDPLKSSALCSISLSTGFLDGEGWPWKRKKDGKQREGKARPRKPKPQKFNQGMKQILQPLTAMVISKNGQLMCPPPIMWMRQTLAKTELCQALRPLDIPFKLAACGVLSGLANLPPGMVKEHFEKFSPGWFVAIHISIPFVAALRKAVVMPKYALIVTIAGAIGGQLIGGRLERARMKHIAEQSEALARGDVEPWDVPFVCTMLKTFSDPFNVATA